MGDTKEIRPEWITPLLEFIQTSMESANTRGEIELMARITLVTQKHLELNRATKSDSSSGDNA